jgi:hypothetical protein
MLTKASLPGLTRQSIRQEKFVKSEMRGSRPGMTTTKT